MGSVSREVISRLPLSRAYLYVALATVITTFVLGAQYAPADGARLSNLSVSEQVEVPGQNLGCPGDCDQDGQVTVDEILRIVDIILGTLPLASCPVLSAPSDIGDVVRAVNAALSGCPQTPTPTPSPTETPIIRLTPFTFKLGEGSRIVYSAPPAAGATPIEEPLSGRLVLAFRELVPQFFNYDVTSLEFYSPGFAITQQSQSDAGDVRVPLTCPAFPIITLRVLINGEPWALSGSSREIPSCPPDLSTINSFEVCNPIGDPLFCGAVRAGTQAGYSLTVVPVLER